jgi:hypothetical protein
MVSERAGGASMIRITLTTTCSAAAFAALMAPTVQAGAVSTDQGKGVNVFPTPFNPVRRGAA